jgi:capsular exopolysaccharide synthesis family protein
VKDISIPPEHLLAEQFRTLAMKIHLFQKQGLGAFVVTSAKLEEGKTFVCARLAERLAGMGGRTLLIDFDNRRPSLHKSFGGKAGKGFTDLVAGGLGDGLESVLQEIKPNLFLIPCGTSFEKASLPQNVDNLQAILKRVREAFPVVLIDTPPLLAVSDASMVAPFVDGVILVIRTDSTKEDEVAKAREMIESVGCRILGTVLNRFNLKYGIGSQKYFNQYVTRS